MNLTTSESNHSNPYATITLLQNELAATNQEVMLLTLELEQRVADRTAQLSKTNRSLQKEVKERREAEAKIRELNADLQTQAAELQTANKDLESFTYSVSHDLRGPLRHINGYASLLRESIASGNAQEIEECIQSILSRTRKMSQLIDDLLEFSRMARVQMDSRRVELGQIVDQVLSDLALEIENRNIKWTINPLPAAMCDPSLIRYALINLVANSLKYSRDRELAEIEIGSYPIEGGQVAVFVKDNGAGFEQQFSHKLFMVFERLHSDREFEGTGIGLANVRRIVERHGGRTWAEGEVGKGATFFFSLPTAD